MSGSLSRPGADGASAGTGSAAPSRARERVSVREASAVDLPTVLELRLALLREHGDSLLYGRLRADVRKRAERLYAAQLASRSEVTFLAEVDGGVVGILRCMMAQGAPLLLPEQYAYISSVYVRPDARRRGVLHHLLAAAEEWSAARGVEELRLHNAADNPVASAVWERFGFEPVEILRIRRTGRARAGDGAARAAGSDDPGAAGTASSPPRRTRRD